MDELRSDIATRIGRVKLMQSQMALRQKTIDTAIVREVISDLDITQHVTQKVGAGTAAGIVAGMEDAATEYDWAASTAAQAGKDGPLDPLPKRRGTRETLSPTEARAYLQRVAGSLKGGPS